MNCDATAEADIIQSALPRARTQFHATKPIISTGTSVRRLRSLCVVYAMEPEDGIPRLLRSARPIHLLAWVTGVADLGAVWQVHEPDV